MDDLHRHRVLVHGRLLGRLQLRHQHHSHPHAGVHSGSGHHLSYRLVSIVLVWSLIYIWARTFGFRRMLACVRDVLQLVVGM